MGVFDSLGKFRKRQPQEETNYLSLTITSNKVLASIWQLFGDELNFIGYSSKNFHNIDGLINEAAVAIDNAAAHIKNDVTQVVFGLSYYWFEDGKVTKETATILKNLSRELDLEAQAFVPISASVNHFLKLQKQEPLDAVYIGAFGDFTEISFLSGENITPKIFKGSATKENITRLLKDLKLEIKQSLPPKIIIYDSDSIVYKDLEKADLKDIFEKEPKLEQFTDEDIAKCIAYSQAADVLGHDPTFGKAEPDLLDEAAIVQPDQVQKEIEEPSNENQEETPPVDIIQAASAGFDFKENEDILELNKAQVTKVETPTIDASRQETFDNLDSDEYAVEIDKHRLGSAHTGYESPGQKIEETKNSHKNNFFDNLLTLSWLSTLTSGFSKEGKGKKLLAPILILLALLVIVIYMVALTFSNAQVIIKANSKPQEADIDVTVASGATIDTTRSRIPGEIISTTVSDSSQTQATGSKKTGNYAKGEVNVLNWTTTKASFDKGESLISKNGIKFKLDSHVEIASRSASTPGQATVSVVAQDYGTSSNISAQTEFTFQKFDELLYSAKNDTAFSGGDEKQVTVVSKDDITKLENNLTDQLTTKARQELKDKNPTSQLTDDAITVKVNKKQFDKNLDDEATSFKLDMEIEATALVYDPNILKELLAKEAQEDSQDKLIATSDNIDILDLTAKRGKDSLKLSGKYRANLIPNINVDELKNKIAGKSIKDARAIIKENPDISDIDIKFNPNLILFSSIPKNPSKINIKVEAIK
jgi:hypothetical protein